MCCDINGPFLVLDFWVVDKHSTKIHWEIQVFLKAKDGTAQYYKITFMHIFLLNIFNNMLGF